MQTRAGFTLIETLLYIAIFSVILVAGIVGAYNIIEGTTRFNRRVLVEAEANFLLRKFSLATENILAVTEPNVPGVGESQFIATRDLGGSTEDVSFAVVNGRMELARNAQPALPLSSDNVTVGNFLVTVVDDPLDGKPGALTITFTVDGKPYTMTRFLRIDPT